MILQFTQVGLRKTGLKNMIFAACYIHLPYSPNLARSDFYLFRAVKKLERIQVADEDQLFEGLQEIVRDLE
jgi:hypothetical protein